MLKCEQPSRKAHTWLTTCTTRMFADWVPMAPAETGEGCGDVEKERDKREELDVDKDREEEDEREAKEEEGEGVERVEGVGAAESSSDTREWAMAGIEAGTVGAAGTVCKHV